MRYYLLTHIILITLSLFHLVLSSPYWVKRTGLIPNLSRRSPYLIVPVDGGASSNNNNDGPFNPAVTPTFTTIAVAATQTSVETEIITISPLTSYITSIKTIEGPTITQVIDVTTTTLANPVTVTKTSYSIVGISSSTQQTPVVTATSSRMTTKPTDGTNVSSAYSSMITMFPSQPTPVPPITTISSTSLQNSTQPKSSSLTASYSILSYSTNSSSMAYVPHYESALSSATIYSPKISSS